MSLGIALYVASTALIVTLTGLVVARRPPKPLWPSFFFVGLAMGTWAVGETAAQFLSTSVRAHWFWVQFFYTGAIWLTPAWLSFALAFCQHVGAPPLRDGRWLQLAVLLLAAVYWLCLVTNPRHGLFITARMGGANDYHAAWYAHAATTYAVFLASFAWFGRAWMRVRAPALRRQIRLVFFASAIPLVANFLFVTRLLPSDLDPTVSAMTVTATLFFFAIYGSHTFALTPFSLQTLVEFEDDVCLVLEPHGLVVAYSRTAVPFFGAEALHPNSDGLTLLANELTFPGESEPLRADDVAERICERSLSLNVLREGSSGEQRALRLTSTVVRGATGRVRGVAIRLRDITVEAQVQESQRLESLGVLAGGIAHDFNNLLTVVAGHAELILSRGDASSRDHESAELIQEASRQAAELTEQMLTYAGRGSISAEPLSVGQLVRDTVGMVRHGISKDITIALDVRDEPAAHGDSSQVRQVIMNLITNAAEALPDEQGQVEVVVRRAALTEEDAQGFVGDERLEPGAYGVIEVRDAGVGIPPDDLARIFDPFFTTKFMGRGLGLASALGIIRAHGGALRARSMPGRGSVFTVFLPWPAGLEIEEPVPAAEAVEVRADGITVLVVDDEPMVLDLVGATLEEAGARVWKAGSGRAAIALYDERRASIDAVVLDLTMPEAGGEEVLAHIRSLEPEQVVIVMSGHAESHITERLEKLGATSFLLKPFSRAEVLDAVGRLLARVRRKAG